MILYKTIKRLYYKKVDALPLGVFRIIISLTILGNAVQLWYFRELIFNIKPGIDNTQPLVDINSATILLFCWMIILISLTLGFWTRFCALLNYGISLVFISRFKDF